MTKPRLVRAETFHERRGGPANKFRYRMDMMLLPMDRDVNYEGKFFSVEGRTLFSFKNADHGFGGGSAFSWARKVLADYKIDTVCDGESWLFTQPRCVGFSFNPVSLWFFKDMTGALRAVIAEVNNTFGDRHAYLCRHDDMRAIEPQDKITAEKVFHVSPFQDVAGAYEFRFHFDGDRVGAWIDFRHGERGLFASVTGSVVPMTDSALAMNALRRPFGALRVLGLIHWQALKLKLKGARYAKRPAPPTEQVTT